MTYYFTKTLALPFDEAVTRTRDVLAKAGFGVISEIDIAKTLKAKIGVDFRPYLILGACNPRMAHQALSMEDKVGTMLPCNVVVQELKPGQVEVAAIDPAASMQAIENKKLREVAGEVGALLKAAVESL